MLEYFLMHKNLKIFLLFILVFSLFLPIYYLIVNTIVFHTDIARDFLLIEDIVKNKPFTLIGPRSGGIPGVFHGPLWLYVNVPIFLISKGNPVAISYFWLFLYFIFLFICFLVAKKLFKNKEIPLLTVVLLAASQVISVRQLFNPFGALFLSPVFFLLIYKYFLKSRFLDLLLSLLVLGLMIQFQMAFAVPLLVLTVIVVCRQIIKNKKFNHLLAFLILIIPLSSFILFDLKHQFIQTKSVINYLTGKENTGKVKLSLFLLIFDRLKQIFFTNTSLITNESIFLLIVFLFILWTTIPRILKEKDKRKKLIYQLFFNFYLGYWFLTLFYRGEIWGYYFWPIAIIFSSFVDYFKDKRVFYVFFLVIIGVNLLNASKDVFTSSSMIKLYGGSWKFYDEISQKIYKEENSEFGYYIFSPDLFGYSWRYAMNFNQGVYPNVKAYPFEKKKTTYLLISPSDNPYAQPNPWKKNQVKITKKPIKIQKYPNGFVLEKYELTDEELKISSDPNLIHTLIFR